MSLILENVTHVYMPKTPAEQIAIEDIQLEIKAGEFLAIIGHTGSGKSTLVQHLNGLLKPSKGKVTVNGLDLHGKGEAARKARQRVGMVFQYPEHQLFEETVYEDIAFGPRNLGLSEEEVKERVQKAFQFVGLDFDEYEKRSPFQLSGGQMRRVAIAGVIALNPEYLVLDEPSAGLDPRGRDAIFGQIVKLYKEAGITVILVSHNMEDVARMANRVLVMNQGRIILDGTPRDIFLNHQKTLQQAGVDVPPLTLLMKRLEEKGLPVDRSVVNMEDAVKSVMGAVRGRRHVK